MQANADLPDWNNPEIKVCTFPLYALQGFNNLVPTMHTYVDLIQMKGYSSPGAFFIALKPEEISFILQLLIQANTGCIESKIAIQHYSDILCTGEGASDLSDIEVQINASINFQCIMRLIACVKLLKIDSDMKYYNISMHETRRKLLGDITIDHILVLGDNLEGVIRDKYKKSK